MREIIDSILHLLKGISKIVWISLIGIILLILAIVGLVGYINKDNHLTVKKSSQRIDITPMQIQSIQQIGQWEFLAINDEELVDTVDRGFFRDKELIRIYYGTLRLGVDLHQAKPQWIVTEDSLLIATLPPIRLLDRNFIDEARTRPFIETGTWTPQDREKLYNKAYNKMLRRCITPENIRIAEDNARTQFTQLFRSMGFPYSRIVFEEKEK